MKAIKDDADASNEPRPSDSEGEYDDDKDFGRNINKHSDLSFNTWRRASKRSDWSVFTEANMKKMQSAANAKLT